MKFCTINKIINNTIINLQMFQASSSSILNVITTTVQNVPKRKLESYKTLRPTLNKKFLEWYDIMKILHNILAQFLKYK